MYVSSDNMYQSFAPRAFRSDINYKVRQKKGPRRPSRSPEVAEAENIIFLDFEPGISRQ